MACIKETEGLADGKRHVGDTMSCERVLNVDGRWENRDWWDSRCGSRGVHQRNLGVMGRVNRDW